MRKKENKYIEEKKLKYIFLAILLITIVSVFIFIVTAKNTKVDTKEIVKVTKGELITATEIEKVRENEEDIKKLNLINDVFINIEDTKENEIKGIEIRNFKFENKSENELRILAPNQDTVLLFNNDSENYINSQIKYSKNENENNTKIGFRVFENGYKKIGENEEIKLQESDVETDFVYNITFEIKVKLEDNKEYIAPITIELNNKEIANNEKVEKIIDLSKISFKLF